MSSTKIVTSPSINAAAAQTRTTISVTNAAGTVNWGPSLSFTKRNDDTLLLVFLRASGYHSITTGAGGFLMNIDSTDYLIGGKHWTRQNGHSSYTSDSSIGGISAGTYTCQLRARCNSAGTMHANGDDTISFMIMEVGSKQPVGALPRLRGIAANVAPGSGNTTSTSYINIGLSKSFTKAKAGSKLIGFVAATAYQAVVGNWALGINGTDYDIVRRGVNEAGEHKTWVGVNEIAGVAAGTFTVELRVKVDAGQLNWDGNDNWSFMLIEVPE